MTTVKPTKTKRITMQPESANTPEVTTEPELTLQEQLDAVQAQQLTLEERIVSETDPQKFEELEHEARDLASERARLEDEMMPPSAAAPGGEEDEEG